MTVESEHTTRQEGQLARASEILPGLIHLLPVTTRPFFPGQAVPLLMDAKHWTPTFKAVDRTEHKIIGVLLARSDYAEQAEPEDFTRIGTACRVHRIQTMEGKLQVLVEGLQWRQREVADLLELSESTVRTHLQRALAGLRSTLDGAPHG